MFLDFSTRCGMVTSAMAAQNEITLNGARMDWRNPVPFPGFWNS